MDGGKHCQHFLLVYWDGLFAAAYSCFQLFLLGRGTSLHNIITDHHISLQESADVFQWIPVACSSCSYNPNRCHLSSIPPVTIIRFIPSVWHHLGHLTAFPHLLLLLPLLLCHCMWAAASQDGDPTCAEHIYVLRIDCLFAFLFCVFRSGPTIGSSGILRNLEIYQI